MPREIQYTVLEEGYIAVEVVYMPLVQVNIVKIESTVEFRGDGILRVYSYVRLPDGIKAGHQSERLESVYIAHRSSRKAAEIFAVLQ